GAIQYVPRCAEGRDSFLAALKEFEPELILASCEVSGISSQEVLAASRASRPETPVIMIAGALSEGLSVATVRDGAADFIVKERLSRLSPAVVRALRESEETAQRRKAELMLEVKYQQLKLQNQALQKSEERFRQLADSVREVFWMSDTSNGQ